jgi:hypothetical protein
MSRTPAEKLIKEGWQKQATYDDPRLSEMAEMYQEIGLEIHLEPFNAENETGCTGCMQLMPDLFKTIYTRRKAGQGMTNDE